MRSAFPESDRLAQIDMKITGKNAESVLFMLNNDNSPYSKWHCEINAPSLPFDPDTIKASVEQYISLSASKNNSEDAHQNDVSNLLDILSKDVATLSEKIAELKAAKIKPTEPIAIPFAGGNSTFSEIFRLQSIQKFKSTSVLKDFIIYSPENTYLRKFQAEGQIEPLGINGEGLLKLLSFHSLDPEQTVIRKVKKSLKSLDWFKDFHTVNVKSDGQLIVSDRFLEETISDFDHKSVNEGFFFLLFYFSLFNSDLTPKFFAIDNIAASLNPKLCRKLMVELAIAAKENDKQAILTTHNPAILDGLNLDDDEQRLFVISRSMRGKTKVKRIYKPKTPPEIAPPKMSELFLRGMLGGLPKGF